MVALRLIALLVAQTPAAVDLHVHLTMHGDVLAPLARSPGDLFNSQITEAGYANAGVKLVVAALWVPPARVGQSKFEAMVARIDALERFAQKHPRFAVVRSADEARRQISLGRVAVFIGIEGADAIDSIAKVEQAFALGVRMISLGHFVDTPLIDAEDGQLGAVLGVVMNGSTRGVTPLGRAVIGRAMELGMIIDVTHASPAAVDEVIELHERAARPLVASHVGSAVNEPRTLRDDQARRIAALGGLIGIGLFRHPMLQPIPMGDRFEGFVEGSCDEATATASHFRTIVGAEHLALGSDLGAPILRGSASSRCPNGVVTDRDLPAVIRAMGSMSALERVLAMFDEPLSAPTR